MPATAIAMPRLGMTMEEGTVVEWQVAVGERVEKGATALVIETEKAESEVEATAAGFLRHVYVEAGRTVPCGTLLGALTDTRDEAFDAGAFAAAHPPPEPVAASTPARATPTEAAGPVPSDRRPIAPAARARARELGIDASAVPGTGPGGRVTRRDVEAYAAARERLVPVAEGVALEVLREGRGDPVALLPGFGVDVSSFALQVPALAERFEVRGVNPRGVGLSDAPETAAYEVARAARDVAAALDAPAHVVGASLGAAVALELALSHPERVRSLALVTPFVEVSARLRAVAEAWCRVAAEASPETLAHFLLPWLVSDAHLGDDGRRARTLRGLAQGLSRVPAATLPRQLAGMLTWSGTRRADLRRVRAPALVLVGADDLLTPRGEELAAGIPGARCVVVREAGHALAIDAAPAVTDAVLEHFSGAGSRSRASAPPGARS